MRMPHQYVRERHRLRTEFGEYSLQCHAAHVTSRHAAWRAYVRESIHGESGRGVHGVDSGVVGFWRNHAVRGVVGSQVDKRCERGDRSEGSGVERGTLRSAERGEGHPCSG